MKRILLVAVLAILPFCGQAQIFHEDFDGNGPGIGAWTTIDNDHNVVNTNVSFISNGWNAIDRNGVNGNFGGPAGNFAAMSTSWYTPPGTSDDWLITPLINLPSDEAILSWQAKAQDPSYPDGYKVMLAPNGGNTIADFTVELFSTSGENPDWIGRSVSLANYAGTGVRIAFVNNSTDMFILLIDDVSVDLVPTTPPDCLTLSSPADGATGINYFSTTLSWNALPAGSPVADSFDVYLDKNPDPTTLVTNVGINTLSYTATNLDPASTYYWKVIPKNNVGSATGCQVFSFTTMDPTYCQSGATSSSFEKISNVTVADINNNSTATSGYEDFTSIVGNMARGASYLASVSVSDFDSGDYVSIWVDYNQDKVFTDDERTDLDPAATSTGTINIPLSALEGNTRMRVSLAWLNPPTPCGSWTFGQTEDYTINIQAPLAVSEATKAQPGIYPNPVKDFVNIVAAHNVKTVEIYDTTGKQVLNTKVNGSKPQLNVTRLASGIYIMKITMEDGSITSVKMIKE